MGILEDVSRKTMQGMPLGLEAGTDPDIAMLRGAQRDKTREDIEASQLGRQAKQMEMDDYLEGREMRRAKRKAGVVEAEEYTSPTGVKERQVKREAVIKLTPAQTDFQVKKIMAQTHEMDQEDFYGRTQHLSESSTQEEYDTVYKDLPDAYVKNLNLTGKFKDDMQTIASAQAAAKDNLPHIRNLELANVKAQSAGKGKMKTPPKPASVGTPDSLRMMVMQDEDIAELNSFWSDAEVDYVARNVGTRADSVVHESWQASVAAASSGVNLPIIQPQEALRAALFTEKALMHDASNDEGLTYLQAEASVQQKKTWINNTVRSLEQNVPNFRKKTGANKQGYVNKAYEAYMTGRYQRLLTGRKEDRVY